jgi:mannose-1-phosphate guanylyltransferase
MDVLVLAGGLGTRLRPLTEGRAKPLLRILDKTLLERVVECVPEDLVDRVVVAAGYGLDEIVKFSGSGATNYEISLSVESEPLGTGGAVAHAIPKLTGKGPVVILNGDLISSVDVRSLLAHHQKTGAMATLSLWGVEDPSRFGVCELDASGMIRRFQEKPAKGTEFSKLINAGCSIVEREVLKSLPDGKFSMEREVFPGIAESGKMAGLVFEGYFVDAGTPSSFIEAAGACIQNNRFSTGHRVGNSWFGEDSVCDGEVESCSIGSGAIVSRGARLRNSVILDGAHIGENVNLESCIVGRGASVPANHDLIEKVIANSD